MSQKNIFMISEGDSYYNRNRDKLLELDKLISNDYILIGLRALSLSIQSVLEIGCSNGWRLEAIRR